MLFWFARSLHAQVHYHTLVSCIIQTFFPCLLIYSYHLLASNCSNIFHCPLSLCHDRQWLPSYGNVIFFQATPYVSIKKLIHPWMFLSCSRIQTGSGSHCLRWDLSLESIGHATLQGLNVGKGLYMTTIAVYSNLMQFFRDAGSSKIGHRSCSRGDTDPRKKQGIPLMTIPPMRGILWGVFQVTNVSSLLLVDSRVSVRSPEAECRSKTLI